MRRRYAFAVVLAAACAIRCGGVAAGVVPVDGAPAAKSGADDAGADVSSVDGSLDAADGTLGDVDASDGALHDTDSQGAVAGCFPRPTGIVSWWRAEGTGEDAVGPNNGTLSNVTFVAGVVGRAFHFRGDGNVLAAATGLPTGANDRTIEMWVRITTTYANTSAFVEGLFFGYGGFGVPNETYELLVVAGGRTSAPQDSLAFSQWGQLADGPQLGENAWHHVAATLRSSALTIYLDGSPVMSETGSVVIDTAAGGSVCMGGLASAAINGGDPASLTGDLDEVTAYDRALAPEEVQGIFQAGSAGKCP